VHDKKLMGKQEISVVFAIDISGSMCVTKEIRGKHSIKADKSKAAFADLMKFSDGSDQKLTGESGNITYISRLQCVQAAIESQIQDMKKGAPDRKLGIVTFNHEVTVIGDGTKDPHVVTGDKLNNYDFLLENGYKISETHLQKPIKETSSILAERVMNLEETGPTALGPALATAIALAGQGAPGSAVVLCTDGLSNVGLGAFDEIRTKE